MKNLTLREEQMMINNLVCAGVDWLLQKYMKKGFLTQKDFYKRKKLFLDMGIDKDIVKEVMEILKMVNYEATAKDEIERNGRK